MTPSESFTLGYRELALISLMECAQKCEKHMRLAAMMPEFELYSNGEFKREFHKAYAIKYSRVAFTNAREWWEQGIKSGALPADDNNP